MIRYFAFLVLLLIPLAPVWLVASNAGLNWTLNALQDRLPLQTHSPEGSLWGGFSLASLHYKDASFSITLENLSVSIAWGCVWQSTLCIEEASVDQIAVEALETTVSDDSSFTAPLPWSPVLMKLSVLNVGELQLHNNAVDEAISNLLLSGSLGASTAVIERFSGKHRLGQWEGRGLLGRDGHWEWAMDVSAEPRAIEAWPEGLTPNYALDFSGDLESLAGSIRASAGVPALTMDIERVSGELTRATGSLMGLPDIVPELNVHPAIRAAGPLNFDLSLEDPENLQLSLGQQVSGFAEAPLGVRLSLRQDSGVWRLTEGTLGEPSAPILSASGTLGEVASLKPELRFEANSFVVPLKPEQPKIAVTGSGQASLLLGDPLGSFAVTLQDLNVREGDSEWSLSGNLRASEVPVLPVGTISGTRNTLPFSYVRTGPPGTPASVSFPQGLPGEETGITALEVQITPGDVTELTLRSEGDLRGDLGLALEQIDGGAKFTLQPFLVYLQDEAIRSELPVTGEWSSESASIGLQSFCLHWRLNSICSDSAQLGQSGALSLAVEIEEELQSAISEKPFLAHAEGAGTLKLAWLDGALTDATFDVDFDHLSLDPYLYEGTAEPIRWEQARASGYLRGDTKSLALDVLSEQLGALRLELSEQGQDLVGSLYASAVDLRSLNDLLPAWRFSSGLVNADMRLSGSRSAPRLFGKLVLDGASVAHPTIETALSRVHVILDATGEGFALDGEAMLGGAPLTLTGLCCDGGALSAKLEGVRNQLELPVVGLEASLSPSLSLVLNEQSLNVGGQLTVHEGVFQHSGPGDTAIALSDDFYRIDLPQSPPRRFDTYVDISALIEPGFTVRSKELEATLSGDLSVSMQPEVPTALYGDLRVLGGELRAYGQVLRLTEGSVGFVGEPLNPALNLSAERRIRAEDLRVGFHIRGSLEEPVFEIFSDPVRSERDTLSYLLRGRGPDAGASVDGTAMALSLGASAINQSGALESLNSIPGLSGVALGAEGSDKDMAATISAYVGERLYLSYGVGIYEPVNALTARLYLRSRLWLEVVSRLESSFDLYYRFDVD
ncbi:translocation/assembly module TamB domain-containing protein [Congregibacter sp.]|uniref:translocation/assembly module TamB domain-containing protein n=1 Tax=Congregibacter sp. TaxID=2744308 RepID=UPI003F6CE474